MKQPFTPRPFFSERRLQFLSLLLALCLGLGGWLAGSRMLAFRQRPRMTPLSHSSSSSSSSSSSLQAAVAAAEQRLEARQEYLLAALAPLILREGHDVMKIERMVDLLLQAGSLSAEREGSGSEGASAGSLSHAHPRIVQFGANDGGASANDPIFHRLNHSAGLGIEAVLVEPVPHLFKAMAASYAELAAAKPQAGSRVRALWAAACPPGITEPQVFYAFQANASLYRYFNSRSQETMNFPPSVQQLGSFSLRYLLHSTAASEEELAQVLLKVQVPCTNLQAIMCEEGWAAGSVDYLHIDAEGFDDKILFASNLAATRPRIVRLEAQHIDADAAEVFLKGHGYVTIRFKANSVAEIVGVRMNAPAEQAQMECSLAQPSAAPRAAAAK